MTTNAAVAAHYRDNSIKGLSEQEVFLRGLHGLVVHIRRAHAVAEIRTGAAAIQYEHLARADRLLVFLMGMADRRTALGQALTHCYTGIQTIIGRALNATDRDQVDAISSALTQAVDLENAITQGLGKKAHGQPA